MIRLFKVYYPVRTLVLLVGEALVVWFSFVLGMLLNLGARSNFDDGWLRLNNAMFIERGYLKILALTGIVLLLSHGLDLYDSARIGAKEDQALRLLFVLGLVALVLAVVIWSFPRFLPGQYSALLGVMILTLALFGWRSTYSWLVRQPFFRERVYVLGAGDRAERLVKGLRERIELGIDVVGWTGSLTGELSRDAVATHLVGMAQKDGVNRVIVALPDRRGTLPVEELLDLRLAGVSVEEATSWLEKISGRIEVEELNPSWLIFSDGFRVSPFYRMTNRLLNCSVAFVGAVLSLPLVPFLMLAVKLDSKGPVLYRQRRMGRGGSEFYCYKFRTMREDAEADTGATWATDDDPRITRTGRFLRVTRLDEIPQLWCVLKGDMNFVGPRPERPEFVERLSREIPYYGVRHAVRPGITGWAQVQYKYGNTSEDAREKLQYDLFYIKNASIGLDLLIWFQTVKIVLLGRGAI
ncbi:MAG TPA: TIGR03013 family XrtA/PEP-CTERM system glycosyltransferase [Candidatus Sulfotelmatobacter sp.]|nr:TIGR03013 family XrtA/PEP-CTERM system glycosyltransferase [Candidatus Sulfotelmatobacter sp.]